MQNIKINGSALPTNLVPSSVSPDTEITRNSERSLSGTLYVDLVYKKVNYTLAWDILTDENYKEILRLFPQTTTIRLELLGESEKEFYVDNISGTPFIQNDQIYWQSVTVKVVEL